MKTSVPLELRVAGAMIDAAATGIGLVLMWLIFRALGLDFAGIAVATAWITDSAIRGWKGAGA